VMVIEELGGEVFLDEYVSIKTRSTVFRKSFRVILDQDVNNYDHGLRGGGYFLMRTFL